MTKNIYSFLLFLIEPKNPAKADFPFTLKNQQNKTARTYTTKQATRHGSKSKKRDMNKKQGEEKKREEAETNQ